MCCRIGPTPLCQRRPISSLRAGFGGSVSYLRILQYVLMGGTKLDDEQVGSNQCRNDGVGWRATNLEWIDRCPSPAAFRAIQVLSHGNPSREGSTCHAESSPCLRTTLSQKTAATLTIHDFFQNS